LQNRVKKKKWGIGQKTRTSKVHTGRKAHRIRNLRRLEQKEKIAPKSKATTSNNDPVNEKPV